MTCEASCLDQFSLLSEKCSGDLRDAFEADKTSTGALATRFFAKCDELLAPILAPAPAPAPGPAMAAIALVEPAPEPAVTFDPLRTWLWVVCGVRPPPRLHNCPALLQGCSLPPN